MDLRDFLIAFFFFIAATIVILGFVVDMYSSDGYNINLNDNNSTKFIGDLQTKAEEARATTHNASISINDKTIGQPGANFKSGSLSEADMISSSLFSLTNIGTFVNVFNDMLGSFFEALGLSGNGVIFWFFTIVLITIVSLILISSVLRAIL